MAQRNNVTSTSRSGSYTQRDVGGQFFLRLSQSAQIFGLAMATRTTDQAGGGSTFWQAGGGAQVQVVRQGLWLRTEGTVSRNADFLTELFLPRESLSLGFNGHVTSRTSVGIDVYVDRARLASANASPWATRSIVRLIQTLPTGSASAPGASGLFRTVPTRAIATVKGMVFADWNGNGLQEAGENPVQGVPLRLEPVGAIETGKNGEFVFRNVPDGLHEVGLDLGKLPIDFEAPPIARLQVALSGNDTLQVAFGLIPLGAIRGRVVRDLNGNGTADRHEPAIDGAVVVLDEGKRSERSKRGQFAFEAVPSGEHTVTLLAESLPEGAMIAGEATRVATLQRDRMSIDLPFLISIETRAEIRKVFPGTVVASGPKPGAAARRDAGSPASRARSERPAAPVTTPPQAVRAAPAVSVGAFTLQVAAFDDPLRARILVGELKQKGLAAYLVEPPPAIRTRPIESVLAGTRPAARQRRPRPEWNKATGGKLWVTREP